PASISNGHIVIQGTPPPVSGATISGTVYNDVNANASRDSGEAGISGRTVYIDANNNGALDASERTTITDASGAYSFAGLTAATDASGNFMFNNLAAGNYKVRQILPSDWKQITPTSNFGQTVTLSTGQNATRKNFGDQIVTTTSGASIAGGVFRDLNSSGTW